MEGGPLFLAPRPGVGRARDVWRQRRHAKCAPEEYVPLRRTPHRVASEESRTAARSPDHRHELLVAADDGLSSKRTMRRSLSAHTSCGQTGSSDRPQAPGRPRISRRLREVRSPAQIRRPERPSGWSASRRLRPLNSSGRIPALGGLSPFRRKAGRQVSRQMLPSTPPQNDSRIRKPLAKSPDSALVVICTIWFCGGAHHGASVGNTTRRGAL